MTGSRILITGIGGLWGSRVAKALEADPNVETIVGLDSVAPNVKLERTEFVPVDTSYESLARVVEQCGIDTIVHTFLVVDPTTMSRARMHEVNVIGTMNLFAAASAEASTVKQVVVKSSTTVYGCAPEDPVWFSEDDTASRPARGRVERSLSQVEGYVRDFAQDNPHITVSTLRFSNVVGANIFPPLAKALRLPLVPTVFGFDPRLQFIHEDDVISAILFSLENEVSGTFNVAGDGVLPWSEAIRICGKRPLWLPPFGEQAMLRPFRVTGQLDLPPEAIRLLKYGRGVDTTRFKKLGFRYQHSSAGALHEFIRADRLRRTVGSSDPEYRYAPEVEQFFKHSPAVLKNRAGSSGASHQL